jgi:hypothetical protein
VEFFQLVLDFGDLCINGWKNFVFNNHLWIIGPTNWTKKQKQKTLPQLELKKPLKCWLVFFFPEEATYLHLINFEVFIFANNLYFYTIWVFFSHPNTIPKDTVIPRYESSTTETTIAEAQTLFQAYNLWKA